jgi:hypothetical protein
VRDRYAFRDRLYLSHAPHGGEGLTGAPGWWMVSAVPLNFWCGGAGRGEGSHARGSPTGNPPGGVRGTPDRTVNR